MFPQITEEPEESLVNLEEEPKSPYSSTPPLNPSCSSSESPPDAPSSPNHEVRTSFLWKGKFRLKAFSHFFKRHASGLKMFRGAVIFRFSTYFRFSFQRFWYLHCYSRILFCIYIFFSSISCLIHKSISNKECILLSYM